jgi:dienelactone hydrolase
MVRRVAWIAFTLLALGLTTGATAGAAAGAAAVGVRPEVRLRAAPDQRYALFLPPGYEQDALPRPILVVLDPRGRALEALNLFAPAARRLGWIVASSYETRSDAGGERNQVTIPALFEDLRRWRIAPRRIYLAGMSGTARAAWAYALGLEQHAAGVIAAAGGLPADVPPRKTGFAYFGTAGFDDFNYGEMRALDAGFDAVDAPHRFEYFAGPHEWPSADLLGHGLLWLEVRAMAEGRRPADPALIRELFVADLADAEAASPPWRALERYRQLRADFAWTSLVDLAPITARLAVLEQDKAVRRGAKDHDRLLATEEGYRSAIALWRAAFLGAETVLRHGESLSLLRVAALRKDAVGDDAERAASARRRLEMALTEAGSYLPQALAELKSWRKAAASFEVATELSPATAWVWVELARARQRLGQKEEAQAALEAGLRLGYQRFDLLQQDPLLRELRFARIEPPQVPP